MSLMAGILVILVLISLYLLWPIIRQKDKIILSEEELKNSLREIYKNVAGEVFVHAGEANFRTYSQLKSVIEGFLEQNPKNRVTFVLGPVISVDSKVYRLIKEQPESLDLEKIHPLFELLFRYPEKVNIYYKKTDLKI